MAVDKLVDSTQLDADLTSVANAIRTKGGTSAQMAFPAGFVSAVQAIPTGQQLTLGLIAEINVTEPVKTIRQVIPQIAIDYGVLLVEVDVTLNTSDYFYCALAPSGGAVDDSNGYLNPATAINTSFYPMILDKNKYGSSSDTIITLTLGTTFVRARSYPTGTVFTDLVIKLYASSTSITSGSIKIYGRLT